MGRRILITGVAGHWGSELARRLERDPEVEYLAGIDSRPPTAELERTELIEADLRGPLLARLIPETEVDTVVDCGIVWYPEPGKPAGALHEINVIGTLQLLAACERTPTLERVVVRGSAAIYGCEASAPAFFTEDLARTLPLRTRFQRDVSELERYFEDFARRRPQVLCCMLRFQPEIGPEIETPLVRYLTLPLVPVQLGFDPRLQFLHADDATGALLAAAKDPVAGPVNVAPDGAISLSRLLGLMRRPIVPVPHPLFGPGLARLARELGTGGLYDDTVRLLRFGRGVDTRRLREELGYEPRFDATEAVRDFAARAEPWLPRPRAPRPTALIRRLARAGGRSRR